MRASLIKGIVTTKPYDRILKIETSIFDNPFPGAKASLIVFLEKSKEIRIIPIDSKEALRIKIETAGVTPSLLDSLMKLWSKYELKVMFSTGFCKMKDKCEYEVLVAPRNHINYESIEYELKTVNDINYVEVQKLPIV